MKRSLCVLLALIMLLCLCACSQESEQGDTSASEESADEFSTEPESQEPEPEPVTVNGTQLSEYRIVYRETSLTAKYLTAARELRDFIDENFGVRLSVISEKENVEASDKEFLVGLCEQRDICEEYFYKQYERGDYYLLVSGSTVLFASSNPNGSHFAVREFCDMLLNTQGEIKDMEIKGGKQVIKVACVGDSITQGINSSDPDKTYPGYLQIMLGPDYYVMNYGVSGYSTCKTDVYAYNTTSAYKKSLAFEPDVVIYALGTNDCNPGQDYKAWEGTNRTELFIESTKELLDSYLALDSHPQIYVCLPCVLYKVGDDVWRAEEWTALNEKYSLPLLKQIAEEYGFQTVDLYTWSKSHPEVFLDGLHPKDETYNTYAKEIYDGIIDTLKKSV